MRLRSRIEVLWECEDLAPGGVGLGVHRDIRAAVDLGGATVEELSEG